MRELTKESTRWTVREMDAHTVPGARGERCLVFESAGAVRRAWCYPDNWASLSDEDLWSVIGDGWVWNRPAGSAATRRISLSTATATDPRAIGSLARSLLGELVHLRESVDSFPEREAVREHCNQTRSEMRSAVESYAQTLRKEGVPPERALVLLKDAVQEGIGAQSDEEPFAEALLREGVEWCITAYYAA